MKKEIEVYMEALKSIEQQHPNKLELAILSHTELFATMEVAINIQFLFFQQTISLCFEETFT